MLLETYSDYLDTLRPYANDTSVKLTAPRAMMSKLTDIAFAKKTNRLDVIRLALAKFIHEEAGTSDSS